MESSQGALYPLIGFISYFSFSPPILPELPWVMVDMYLAIVLHQAMEEITQGVGEK